MTSPVSLAAFKKVDDYAHEFDGLSPRKKRLRPTHPLVLFAETFLEQFAKNHLKAKPPIAGLTLLSANRLRSLRRSMAKKEQAPRTRLVIFSLEPLCELLAEASYDRGGSTSAEFHLDYFPALLRTIADWAREELEDEQLAGQAEETLQYYESTVLADANEDYE